MLDIIGKIYGEVYGVATFSPALPSVPAEPSPSGQAPYGPASLRRQPRSQWSDHVAAPLLAQACPLVPDLGKA